MSILPEFVEQLTQRYLRKLLRYFGVSAFNLVFGQSLLFFFHTIVDWPGWIANITAVMISAAEVMKPGGAKWVPAYSPAGTTITTPACPGGESGPIMPVLP